jgi:mono/diheme cytochrome c family protein
MIIPTFGLLYLSGNLNPSGCADGSVELAVNRATGIVQNCDGTPFEGKQTGGGPGGQFLTEGAQLYTECAGCHGANGQGGVGPAFAQVLVTFGSCADHVEWVRLGSNGFLAAGRTTYGDIAKPVHANAMPAHPNLSEEEIASVVAYERVRFGGGNADAVLTDCGLIQAAGGTTGSTTAGETTATTTAGGTTATTMAG